MTNNPPPYETPFNHESISRQSIGTNDTFEESIVINKPLEEEGSSNTMMGIEKEIVVGGGRKEEIRMRTSKIHAGK